MYIDSDDCSAPAWTVYKPIPEYLAVDCKKVLEYTLRERERERAVGYKLCVCVFEREGAVGYKLCVYVCVCV